MPGRKEPGTSALRILPDTLSFKNKSSPTSHESSFMLFLITICRIMLPENTPGVRCGTFPVRGQINIRAWPGDNTGLSLPHLQKVPGARSSGLSLRMRPDLWLWPSFWGTRRETVNLRMVEKIIGVYLPQVPHCVDCKCWKELKI